MNNKNYVIHVKPVENDPGYKESIDILKEKGFCLATVVRSLLKKFANKVENSDI